MSSKDFREFINQRLTAAAAEIFEVFEKTINNYKDEVDRYKDMLEIVCNPHVKMHQIELPQQLIDPEPHRPESSDNGENITCMNQDGAEVLEKQDIKECQGVGPIKSEPDQLSQPQSSTVVPLNKDQDGREDRGRPMVKMEEDKDLLHGKTDVVGELSHHPCMKTSDHSPDPCGSESTRTEEDNQVVGIIQEKEQSVQKQEDGQGQRETASNSDPNRQPNEKPFKCDTCGISFSRKYSLKNHMKVHTGKKVYPCETCGKCFAQKHDLDRHRLIHKSERRAVETSKKSLTFKSVVKKHNKVWLSEKPHSCEICGKCFAYKNSQKRHMVIHTGERPFSCATCGKTFVRSYDLRLHRVVHTGEKPFSCATCGKTFAHSKHLSCHQVVHTGEKPYHCKKCGKYFGLKCNLDRHMLIHVGERPCFCEKCGKLMANKRRLREHMKVHEAERPYSCDVCSKRFVRKGHLQTHMKIHKSEKPYTGSS